MYFVLMRRKSQLMGEEDDKNCSELEYDKY